MMPRCPDPSSAPEFEARMTSVPAFTIARLPRIEFGSGRLARLPDLAAEWGSRVLVVTGRISFRGSDRHRDLLATLDQRGCEVRELTVEGEPSPDIVDQAVAANRADGIDVVVGVGGGSVLDAAKAIAGLLRTGTSAMDHLEVVGRGLPYPGPTTPFIAAPTTAGTGSESTKNAVLSRPGPGGFKRSFRDDRLVARVALVDPDLLASLPAPHIAREGADAFSQLLEPYVSTGAGSLTDGLALAGLEAVRDGLLAWFEAVARGEPEAPEAVAGRERMAFAALVSGICLANAGLGAIHGLAAALGGRVAIPHGAACGAVLAEVTEANIRTLEAREPAHPALDRYARVGRLLAMAGRGPGRTPGRPPGGRARPAEGDGTLHSGAAARIALVETLVAWRGQLRLPRLRDFGLAVRDLPGIVAESRAGSMRTNPVTLTDDELTDILQRSL